MATATRLEGWSRYPAPVAPSDRTEVLLDILRDVARDVRKEVEPLGAEELSWRPDPRANSIGVTVWHVARWFDLLAHRILRGLDASDEIWHRERWAERTGYDQRGVGLRGWGAITGYTVEEVARIPQLSADQLVAYLDASADALAAAVAEIGSDGLSNLPRGYSGSRSVYDWVKLVLEGALGHLGEIRSLKALHGWGAGAPP